MKSHPAELLNQLVVAALTVFIIVVILMAALVLRQFWLQQQIVDLSNDVQVRLDDLEETHDEIQHELAEVLTAPVEAQDAESWQEITAALDDVDEQLDSIGENLNDVSQALESPPDDIAVLTSEEQSDIAQDQVDQVFTIFAVIVGMASIAIAILLGRAVQVHQDKVPNESEFL